MFISKNQLDSIIENQRYLNEQVNNLQQQLNTLVRHFKLQIYKPHQSYQIVELPTHMANGGLVAGYADQKLVNTLGSSLNNPNAKARK